MKISCKLIAVMLATIFGIIGSVYNPFEMTHMKRNYDLLVFFIPIAIVIISIFLFKSPVLSAFYFSDKALPHFQTNDLLAGDQFFTDKMLTGHTSYLVVWASWCPPCRGEDPALLQIQQEHNVSMYGIDLKDNPEDARRFLNEYGNPFIAVGLDPQGIIADKLGVYGTPQSFLIDKQGIIRYSHLGPMTEALWEAEVQPLIEQLGKP